MLLLRCCCCTGLVVKGMDISSCSAMSIKERTSVHHSLRKFIITSHNFFYTRD